MTNETPEKNESLNPDTFPREKVLSAYVSARTKILANDDMTDTEQMSGMWALVSLLTELGIIDDNMKLAEFGAYCSKILKYR